MELVLFCAIVLVFGLAYLVVRLEGLSVRVSILEHNLRAMTPSDRQLGAGRGRALRLRANVPAQLVFDGQRSVARVVDLSASGAQIRTDAPLVVEATLSLVLDDPGGNVAATAVVMRTTGPQGYGVRFVDPSPAFRRVVKRLRKQALDAALTSKT